MMWHELIISQEDLAETLPEPPDPDPEDVKKWIIQVQEKRLEMFGNKFLPKYDPAKQRQANARKVLQPKPEYLEEDTLTEAFDPLYVEQRHIRMFPGERHRPLVTVESRMKQKMKNDMRIE